MDTNEISFEAILHNPEFKRCRTVENMRAAALFEFFLDENFPSFEMREKVAHAVGAYLVDSENAAFEQGFRFAVKLMKFIDKAG